MAIFKLASYARINKHIKISYFQKVKDWVGLCAVLQGL